MVSVQALANTVLKKSFDEKIPVTPMKLQKLLYFICAQYMKNNDGKPLISERFEVWQYGPVLSSAYYEFNAFRARPIQRFAKDAQGTAYIINPDSEDIMRAIDQIWHKYKHYTAAELSSMTHQPGSAWTKAHERSDLYLREEDMIDEKL